MKKILFILVGLMLSILPLAAQNKTARSVNQAKRTEVRKTTPRKTFGPHYSYKTSQKTRVMTAKGNRNKIVALLWANLCIVTNQDYLKVYRLKHRRWKPILISKNEPGTHSFDQTYAPEKFDSRTVVVTIPEEGEDIGVSVIQKGALKETCTLRK